MKVKDIIYRYEIELDFKDNKVKQEQKPYQVIGYNDTYLAINDQRFSTIKHRKLYRGDNYDTLFNEVSVFDYQSTYNDFIRATLYTQSSSKKIAYKRMKKELEKFIYKKHGRYCNAITMLDKVEV